MPRTLLSLGLVVALVGCGPTVIVQQPPPTTGTNGSTNGSTGGTTSGTTAGTGGTSGGTTSGTTAGTGGTSGGTTSGTTAGTGGTSGGTTSGTTAGTGGTSGGTTSGTGGTSGGTTSGTGGTTGGTTVVVVGPGAYDAITQYNFLDALPPDVEEAVKLALEFTNSPGAFLLDMAAKIPVIGYVVEAINLFSGIRDKITMGIDSYINDWSGGMVTTMHNLSVDVEMALRGLKSKNHLVMAKADAAGNMATQDTLVQLIFTYHGTDYFYPQDAHATTTANLKGLQLSIPGRTYDKGVRVGGMLVDLIDNIALPELTGVNSIGELLNQLVNCGGVGTRVWGFIYDFCIGSQCIYQYISADDISKLCMNALDAVGRMIEDKISTLDAPGVMSMSDGTCLAVENKGHTGHADTLMSGKWALTLPVGVATMTLPGDFTGVLAPDAPGR